MRWRRILIWSVFGLFALLTLGIGWLWSADLGLFKPQIEAWISDKTGREFSIEGDFQLDLARHSVVVAEGIRLQNANWADEPQMLQIGRLEVRLDLYSVFRGPLQIELIDIDDATIHLTRPDDGDPNWVFRSGTPAARPETDGGDRIVLFKQIDIDRTHLEFRGPQRTKPIVVNIDYLKQHHQSDDFLTVALQGKIGDRQLALSGRAGTWGALRSGRDIHYDFEGRLDTLEIASSGWIDDLTEPYRPTLNFTAAGPDINDVTRLLAIGETGSGNIDVSGSLTPQDNGPLVLEVQGNIGQTEIQASGVFSDLQALEEIDIDMLASGPDLGRILTLFGIHQIREAPFMITLDAERNGPSFVIRKADMVFGEAQFELTADMPNFPSLDDGSVRLDVNGPDIERFRFVTGLPGVAGGAFSIGFGLDVSRESAELFQLDLQSSLGRLESSGRLGPAPDYIGTTMQFQLTSDSLMVLGDAYGVDSLPDKPVDITGNVRLNKEGIRTVGPVLANVNDVFVRAEGLIALVHGLTGSDIEFGIEGPDLAVLANAFGARSGVPGEPYELSGTLQVQADGYRFRGLRGNIGTSAVDAAGVLSNKAGLAGTRIAFEANGPAFEEVIDELGDIQVHPGPYTLSGDIELQRDALILRQLQLQRERIDVDLDLTLGLPIERRVSAFDLRGRGSDVRFLFAGIDNFEAEAAPFSLEIRGELQQGDWSIDSLDAKLGDAHAAARGILEFDQDVASTRFRFNGQIPSLAKIGRVNGRNMRDQALSWDGSVSGGDGVLQISDMLVRLGNSDINGNVIYRIGDVPQLDIDVTSDSLRFAPLMEDREIDYDPQPEFSDGRLIPDIAVPFDAMKKTDVFLRVNVGELERDALYLRDVRLHADLQDGTLQIHDSGFRARAGRLDLKAKLEPDNGAGRMSLQLLARNFAFGISELNQDLAMTGNIDISLESTGADLRTLAGNANGAILINTRGGRIANNRFMQAVYGDILDEVFSTINPFFKSETHTDIECVVIPYQLEDGQVTSTPATLVSTSKMHIASKGTIDLKSEKIDANIRTTPRKSIGISAGEIVNPYVKLVGTLARPRLAVDETGVLLTGGAAVATGGISILAKAAWDRLSRAGDPCKDAAEEALEKLGDRLPPWVVAEAEIPETDTAVAE